MSDETPEVTLDELDERIEEKTKSAVVAALEQYEAKQREREEAERKAQEEREAEREVVREEVVDELIESGEFIPARKGGFNINDNYKAGLSNKDEYGRAVRTAAWRYIKSGDSRAWRGLGQKMEDFGDIRNHVVDFSDPDIKAAFQEGTGSEGGILVPNDFFPGIIEKRDQVSWPRQAGVRVMQTNRDIIDIPAENAKQGIFAVTAEEASYDTDAGPTFSNVQVTIHKFTRTHRVSEELEADEAVGFPTYLQNSLGRAWGLTENRHVAIGTGSSEPEGVMVGADTDDILTLDSGATMTTDEIPELFYKLQQQYRRADEAIWLMNEATEAVLVGRLSQNQLEVGGPLVTFERAREDGGVGRLMGYRVYNDANVGAVTTGSNFAVLFGNMFFYALVERQGLVVTRNPFLYEATGQIGIFARARWGGAVLQDEAFKVAQSTA